MEPQSFPDQLVGSNIILKKHQLNLTTTMFAYIDQDRERLRQFLPWVDSTKTIEDVRIYINSTHEKWKRFELFDYGIFLKHDLTYMGNVGIHTISWDHQRCEIGYWILGSYEGKGHVSEAVSLIAESCYKNNFNRLEIRCSSNNERSASIPKRLGFKLDGTLRADKIEQGKFRDTLIYGKLKSD